MLFTVDKVVLGFKVVVYVLWNSWQNGMVRPGCTESWVSSNPSFLLQQNK